MNRSRTRVVLWCALTCALVTAVPTVASADSVVSKLRVEADGQALDPGTKYANKTVRKRTSTLNVCKGSGDRERLGGPNAMGIVDYAAETNREVSPLRVSDRFDFGLVVCGIGDFLGFKGDDFWLYKVNHEAPTVGADELRLDRRDEVLWYFVDGAQNSGKELDLRAPVRSAPGPVQVTAFTYSDAGERSPAPGATIQGGAAPATTNSDGRATVVLTQGSRSLRAVRGNDIPSAPESVCVNSDVGSCPDDRGERIIGTDDDDDDLDGSRGPDVVRARRGDDRIDVRGGDRDKVDCSRGRDRVRADSRDDVSRDCEAVNR